MDWNKEETINEKNWHACMWEREFLNVARRVPGN